MAPEKGMIVIETLTGAKAGVYEVTNGKTEVTLPTLGCDIYTVTYFSHESKGYARIKLEYAP